MKYLLTGATGYIGHSLCKKLINEGHDVACVIRKTSKIDKLLLLGVKEFIVHEGIETTASFLETFSPDVVFHLSSLFIARHKPEDIADLIQSNVTFPTTILEAMQLAGSKNFVNIGTLWQNFEDERYNPTCLYAATKQAFCDILRFYSENYGITNTTLKLSDTYGPNDNRAKILNLLVEISQTGEVLKMSAGEQLLDYVYIDDVTSAICKAGDLLTSGHKLEREYAVSTKQLKSLKEIAKIVETVSQKELNIEWGALAYREREIMSPWCGGKWIPGWEPKTEITDGIKRILKTSNKGI